VRWHLALLHLHVGLVWWRAKANVPNQRWRYIESSQGAVSGADNSLTLTARRFN